MHRILEIHSNLKQKIKLVRSFQQDLRMGSPETDADTELKATGVLRGAFGWELNTAERPPGVLVGPTDNLWSWSGLSIVLHRGKGTEYLHTQPVWEGRVALGEAVPVRHQEVIPQMGIRVCIARNQYLWGTPEINMDCTWSWWWHIHPSVADIALNPCYSFHTACYKDCVCYMNVPQRTWRKKFLENAYYEKLMYELKTILC